jgi:hypothetical protein
VVTNPPPSNYQAHNDKRRRAPDPVYSRLHPLASKDRHQSEVLKAGSSLIVKPNPETTCSTFEAEQKTGFADGQRAYCAADAPIEACAHFREKAPEIAGSRLRLQSATACPQAHVDLSRNL